MNFTGSAPFIGTWADLSFEEPSCIHCQGSWIRRITQPLVFRYYIPDSPMHQGKGASLFSPSPEKTLEPEWFVLVPDAES